MVDETRPNGDAEQIGSLPEQKADQQVSAEDAKDVKGGALSTTDFGTTSIVDGTSKLSSVPFSEVYQKADGV